ncbi:MAG: uncharacterized protein QOC77_2732 [Thermoleophilaceae bacterium]|nr:uncharacterized protein [Thermoleophilaceae bacterium]
MSDSGQKRFVVWRDRGPGWDPSRDRREQDGWNAHASFMDGLVESGFIELGGPVGDGERALHICRAPTESEVRRCLADDPWSEEMLYVASVEPWDVLLDAGRTRGGEFRRPLG